MELALDGAATARALLGDQIHSRVVSGELRSPQRPFRLQPDLGETLFVKRILDEARILQPLEEAPLVGFGTGDGSDVIQRSLKNRSSILFLPKHQAVQWHLTHPDGGAPVWIAALIFLSAYCLIQSCFLMP